MCPATSKPCAVRLGSIVGPEPCPTVLPGMGGQDFGSDFGPVSQVRQNFSCVKICNFDVLRIFSSGCKVT